MRRERDQIDVHRQKHQLDRHQNDDDVLPVEEDAEDAEREQDRRHGQIMREADRHHTPPRVGTLTSSIVSAFRSEEHTSDLQSLIRISYAAFCWKKKKPQNKP